jgi:hypothetical protein
VKIARIPALIFLAAVGCEGQVAPFEPTWADVRPILQGACFHCHGAPGVSGRIPGAFRWDVYDVDLPIFAAIAAIAPPFKTAVNFREGELYYPMVSHWTEIPQGPNVPEEDKVTTLERYIRGQPRAGIVRMPPPPATPMSGWDLEVIRRWVARGAPHRNPPLEEPPPNNSAPTAAWLEPGKRFQVSDPDSDQVLGRITCAGVEGVVNRTGAHPLPANGAPPCTLKLSDGYFTSLVTLP